jgi:hypothetical protein
MKFTNLLAEISVSDPWWDLASRRTTWRPELGRPLVRPRRPRILELGNPASLRPTRQRPLVERKTSGADASARHFVRRFFLR